MTARPLGPAPETLGLASPALGPWFADATLSLAAPEADLGVSFSPASATDWLPPARGVLSLLFATTTRPPLLAPLRQADGRPAFGDGHLVALFRLLPEVEFRLRALARHIPSADIPGVSTVVATRGFPRWLALELPGLGINGSVAQLKAAWVQGFSPDLDTDAKKLDHMGLGGSDGALANGRRPCQVLLAPGTTLSASDKLLRLGTAACRLWAFDARGRAVDPGAVASWWSYLATQVFNNLWAPGVAARTCGTTAGRRVHFVNLHEGPAPAALLGRLQTSGLDGTANDVVRAASGSAAVALSFSAAPDPDDAPQPRMALLPHRALGASLALWPSGPVAPELTRDQLRVTLTDLELHLTGQPRVAGSGATPEQARRAADQARAVTRIEVAAAAGPAVAPTVLRSSLDDVADSLVALLAGADAATLVTGQLDRDFGAFAPLVADTDPMPTSLPEPTVTALVGGGTSSGGTVSGQRVLMEFAFNLVTYPIAGAMLRVWPNEVDLATGRRRATDGGAGRVLEDGKATLVVQLPDGADGSHPLGATAVLVNGTGSRLFGEFRFTRPAAVGGTAVVWGSVTGALLACEQARFTNKDAASGLLPGVTLVAIDGSTATLVDRDTVPAAVWDADTVMRTLAVGDRVVLTQPAFRAEPRGSSTTLLAAGGAAASLVGRSGITRPSGAGTPLPSQQVLTSAAAALAADRGRAVVLPGPALARWHEVGAVQLGHPGAPAAPEHVGVGVELRGPAAVQVAEALSAQADFATSALAAAAVARTSAPTAPASPALWAATLRTLAVGVEGERDLADQVGDTGHPFPFDGTASDMRTWFSDHTSVTVAPPPAGREAALQRALGRRARAAASGLIEAAVSLRAAFSRAEDFVYIETGALDLLPIDAGGEAVGVLAALLTRLGERPALCAIVCVPVAPPLGTPADLKRVWADGMAEALRALDQAAPGRVAAFTPSAGAGRTPRLWGTLVIVDDVYALCGNTPLSRRSLSFDTSLSVALCDESIADGRGRALGLARREVLARRLGLAAAQVPEDGLTLVRTIRRLADIRSERVSTDSLPSIDPAVTATDRALWNRDGTTAPNPTDLAAWLSVLTSGGVLS